MSFWNFLNFAQTSKINSKLSEPGTTLEDLLGDDSIITEFKSLNPKLLDFCTDIRVKQMLSYLIEEPPQDADRDRGYKFPFVSCEVLTADVETLLEAFFGRNPNNLKTNSGMGSESREEAASDLSGDRSGDRSRDDDEVEHDHSDDEKTEEEKPTEPVAESTEEKTEEKEPQEAQKEDETKESSEEKKEENAETEEKKEENTETEEKKEESTEETTKEETAGDAAQTTEEVTAEVAEEKLEPDELPNYFFSFLDSETLNETLVGYFSRFLTHIINRKENDIEKYVWEHPEVIDKLIAHVDMRSLAECLSKLFLLEPSHSSEDFTDIKLEKLKKLAEVLNTEDSALNSDSLNHTALIFTEIFAKKSSLRKKAYIESYIYSQDFLDILFKNLGRNATLSPHVASILNALLNAHIHKDDFETSHEDYDSDSEKKEGDAQAPEIDYSHLHSSLATSAGLLVDILKGETDLQRATTYGATHKPLGTTRLRVVEMVFNMIRLGVHEISLALAEKGVFKALMDLMVQYEWNNMLHNFVQKILVSVLESKFQDVRDKLLNEADLLEFLVSSTQDVDYTMPNAQKRKLRRGYLGQITRIAKLLERLGEVDASIKEYLANDKWNKFREEYLQVTLEKDNKDLAKSTRKESEDYGDVNNNVYGTLGQLQSKLEAHANAEAEDDINDRDDDNREEGHDFTDNDVFNKYGSNLEEWSTDNQAGSHTDNKDFWSMSPSDFSTTFKFGAFPGLVQEENTEDVNKYLELNRKLEVIDIGPQHDDKLEQAYFDNSFWSKPKSQEHNIDDILKEFEGH